MYRTLVGVMRSGGYVVVVFRLSDGAAEAVGVACGPTGCAADFGQPDE